jgi:cell division protease FtsH
MPSWLWLLVIGMLGLIFWQFGPRSEVEVVYYPWFVQRVEAGNIQSLAIEGTELRGVLRHDERYVPPKTATPILVRRFITHAPSEDSIHPMVQTLIEIDKKTQGVAEKPVEPTRIDVRPNSASGLAWFMLLLPTFLVLVFIYVMTQNSRDQSGGAIRVGVLRSAEEIVSRTEVACLQAAKLCRVSAMLSDLQRERLERATSELAKALKGQPQPEV